MTFSNRFIKLVAALMLTAAAAATAHGPALAQAGVPQPECTAPIELIRLDNPLKRLAQKVAIGQPITIVAIGSSSTAGAGASSPAMSYPSRLLAELNELFPRTSIAIANRGIGGEDIAEMLARFNRDVFAANPDLVLWQVGSNMLLRGQPVLGANALLREGLKRLKAVDTDVVLINPQYAPKVIERPEANAMVDLIDAAARDTEVDLFQRFAVMRYWRLTEDMPFSAFLSPDELHMNDWSYGCIAKLLARSIHEAATRATVTAAASR
jgi:acyl-CoA thioesterase I